MDQTFASQNVGAENLIPTGTISDNYNVTYVDTVGSITQATANITASSGTMTYGGTIPTITPFYSGLQNSDTAPSTPATCSTTATSALPVGSYTSSCSGAADPNYTFTYTPGSVSVTTATLTITATNTSKDYGAALPTLAVSYSRFNEW